MTRPRIAPGPYGRLPWLILLLGICINPLVAEERDLVIIHTNDFHGHISEERKYAGAARISAFVKQQRARHPGVLFLDAGDAVSGTPVSTMYKGLPIFRVMNAMGYDYSALGNHEFDHGYRHIARFLDIARQPILSANAFNSKGELLADEASAITNVNGVTVGIIGIMTDRTPTMITPVGNEGLVFLNPKTVLKQQVTRLRPKVDLLIVLSHTGHEEEKTLAGQIPGIDLIVGGHSHTLVNPPVRVGSTWVAQANRYGTHVGLLRITVDTDEDRITRFSGKLVAAAELPEPDLMVLALVNTWENRVQEQVDVQIATSSREIAAVDLQPVIEAIIAEAASADFGYYNIGGIRDDLPKGPVTARDIWNIEPFGNSLVILEMKGSDYLILLSREQEIHPGVDDIDPDRRYRIATNSFIGAHAARAFGDEVIMHDLGVLVRDVLIEHIQAHGI